MPLSRNRTRWPYKGGAISIQPGWFQGHQKALFYINMGISAAGHEAPPNMSHPLVPPFQIIGPSDETYAGQFCLPQVPMPVNVSLSVGDNVTIQVIEVAQFGAALYNVSLRVIPPHQTSVIPLRNAKHRLTGDAFVVRGRNTRRARRRHRSDAAELLQQHRHQDRARLHLCRSDQRRCQSAQRAVIDPVVRGGFGSRGDNAVMIRDLFQY